MLTQVRAPRHRSQSRYSTEEPRRLRKFLHPDGEVVCIPSSSPPMRHSANGPAQDLNGGTGFDTFRFHSRRAASSDAHLAVVAEW
jgi:hypothetical protein